MMKTINTVPGLSLLLAAVLLLLPLSAYGQQPEEHPLDKLVYSR